MLKTINNYIYNYIHMNISGRNRQISTNLEMRKNIDFDQNYASFGAP